ncbi:helix-turn-helix domain-containing protein [Leucobacter sp. CX42]|uniref:winged helix-turn-helix transcriptional regulator n=1 Tax=unclassified Leucobacter TaxID=2621730 RepID=UPI00334296D8
MSGQNVTVYGVETPNKLGGETAVFAEGAASDHQLVRSAGHDEPRMQHICAVDDQQAEVFRSILARVGDKWSMMLIGMLQQGPYRFTELKRMTPGISSRMLTFTLRQLERDGLVERTVYAEIPPRVEYRATVLGSTLVGPVMAIAEWALTHQTEIVAFRDRYDHAQDESSSAR